MAASVKLAKCLLVSFNILFWLCGIALMALGLFVLITLQSDDLMRSFRDKSLEVDREVFWISIGMIGVGFIAFLVGFCGCCGAVRDSTVMNGFYIFLLVLIVGGEVAGGVFAVLYRGRVEAVLKQEMTTVVRDHYTHNDTKSVWSAVSLALDRFMYQKRCCGVTNYTDWWNSTYMRESGGFYPVYCCEQQSGSNFTAPLAVTTSGKCHKDDTATAVYKTSCYGALHDFLQLHAIIIIAILCSFAALQLAGIAFAGFFCHRLLHPPSEQAASDNEEEREPMANNDKDEV